MPVAVRFFSIQTPANRVLPILGETTIQHRSAIHGSAELSLTTGSNNDTSLIFFSSDWSECWIGQNEQFEIQISSEAAYIDNSDVWHSSFQNDQSLFRASTHHDLGLRRTELFVVVEGVRA